MKRNITTIVLVAFLGGVIGRGVRYLLNVVIARGLGPEALGTFAFGLVVLKLLSVFAKSGLDNAALKYVPRYRSENDTEHILGLTVIALGFPLVTGGTLVAVLILARPLLTPFFDTSLLETLPLFAVGIPLFSAMFVGIAVTRGYNESKYAVYTRDFGQSVTALGLVAISAYLLADFEAVVWSYTVSLACGLGLVVWFLWKQKALRSDIRPRFELKEWLVFSIPMAAIAVANYLMSWTDVLMLGAFVSPADLGWYQASYQTSVLLLVVLKSSNSIFPSLASGLYDSNELQRLESIHSAITKWILYLTGLGGIYLVLYRSEVLSLFGGSSPEAETALVVLAVGQFITASVGSSGYILSMSEYERLNLLNTVVTVLLNVGLNYVLIQQYGIVGASVATAVSLSVYNLVQLVEVYVILGIFPYSRTYWRGAIGVAVGISLLLVGQFIPLFPLGRALLAGFIALLGFGVTIWLLGFDQHDRLLVESLD